MKGAVPSTILTPSFRLDRSRLRPRVLMVDDDPIVRAVTCAALETCDFDLVEEADGLAAVATYARERPDLVLLDVHLGTTTGFDVCRGIRAREDGETVPIIMLTGDTDEATIGRAFDCGATDFERKGVAHFVLAKRLRFLHRAQQVVIALRESQRLLASAQRIAHVGSWDWSPSDGVHRWSLELHRLLGFEPGAFRPSHAAFLARIHPDDAAGVDATMRAAVAEGREYELEYRVVLPGGAVHVLHHRGEPVREDGRTSGLRGTLQDITPLRDAEDRIRRLERYDSLTGLPNRGVLLERAEAVLGPACREPGAAAIVVLDLDGFKHVNDTLGHHMGDRLLERAAERLRGAVRASDTVARMEAEDDVTLCRIGGDEFAILVSGGDADQDFSPVACRLTEAMRAPFDLDGEEVALSASAGVAVFPKDGTDAATLLKRADAAVHAAKEAGRGSVRFFDPALDARAARRFSVEAGLRHALERDELCLHYQPIVDAESGRTEGAECLVRWEHPERGLVPPGGFIGIAEDSGLIVPLTEWVVRSACAQQAGWARTGTILSMSFNISSRHFHTADVAELLRSAVEGTGADPRRLTIEITESLLLRDEAETRRTLGALKEMGVRIALDDFGTGYSSLGYLRQFPVDRIKVDRSFVQGVDADEDAAALVEAIALLSRRLGIEPLAEGVETERQCRTLRRIGYRTMQGFLFGRPMPAADLAAMAGRSPR